MIPTRNDTGFPHFCFEKLGTGGGSFDVIVLRGTYELAANGATLPLAEAQDPICFADEYEGPVEETPLAAWLRKDGDLVSFKPSSDVHVIGTARPPGAKAVTDWVAKVRVGPVEKRLRLLGPRRFVRDGESWTVTSSEPVDAVPLDYRRAFGGTFTVPAEALPGDEPEYLTKTDNPAGCGWLPDEEALERASEEARPVLEEQVAATHELTAPQIEDPDEPITSPTQGAAAQGFGPLARWWGPRIELAGTFDDRWREEVAPAFPEDFDPAFYQSAHPDLITPAWLTGDEAIELEGLLEEGAVSMRLPARVLVATAKRRSGEIAGGRMQLDTLSIDLDRRVVSLVWRGAFSKGDPVVALHLEDVTDRVANRPPTAPQPEAQHG